MRTCPQCHRPFDDETVFCPRDGAVLALQPGTVLLKKYEVESEIARGGMAIVYRARHLHFGEDMALKILKEADRQAFLAEARVLRRLRDPHIVRVEDADFLEDGRPFLAMEFVEGEDLGTRLAREGSLAPSEALRIASETCAALAAAHDAGIIHRDLAPKNLLLAGSSGAVKVIDFGIAKVRKEAAIGFTGVQHGTTGFFLGTPRYASPEQALTSPLDGRTDLYSLGLVLYEMLSGKLPFDAASDEALLQQRCQLNPIPLSAAAPDLPPAIVALVMRAIERGREARFQTPREMQAACDAARGGLARQEPTRRTKTNVVITKPHPKDGLTYVWIPPGRFTMGCSDSDGDCYPEERPAHLVTISKGFWLSQTEVTQAAYQAVMGATPSRFRGDRLPVDSVTWDEAQAYCRLIGGRLPTEAEWEYAARAGNQAARYGPVAEIAWHIANSNQSTHAVGEKQANAFGLYDMLGNVWEWAADWYGDYLPEAQTDPKGPSGGMHRVLRGGSWSAYSRSMRASNRDGFVPAHRDSNIGFRCVWEL